jgi:hypothetical protein
MSLCGCFSLGSTRLYEDRLGYSRALGNAEKSDTLLNVVRLRYADTPIVLQATQVISGYQLQRNVTGGFEAFPAANPSTFLSGSASAQLQQSPTFTFQPLSGAQFAQNFIRPLAPPMSAFKNLRILLLAAFVGAIGLAAGERFAGPGQHRFVSVAEAVVGRPLTPVSVCRGGTTHISALRRWRI